MKTQNAVKEDIDPIENRKFIYQQFAKINEKGACGIPDGVYIMDGLVLTPDGTWYNEYGRKIC